MGENYMPTRCSSVCMNIPVPLLGSKAKKARHGKGYERGINEIGLALLFEHSLYKPLPFSVSKYVTPETYRSLA